MSYPEYWQEAFEEAMHCMNRSDVVDMLTEEQRAEVGQALEISHDNYGMAHYSPPSSDRYDSIDREWKTKYDRLQKEFDAYRGNAETAVKRALRQNSDANVSIGDHGEVTRWGGRSERIL